MNEPMVQRKLSRNGPVSVEVSKALTAMDVGPEICRVWNELDCFITAVVRNDRENVIQRAMDLTDRMVKGPDCPGRYLVSPGMGGGDCATAINLDAWHQSWRIDCVPI